MDEDYNDDSMYQADMDDLQIENDGAYRDEDVSYFYTSERYACFLIILFYIDRSNE